jgi:hypothetical protein
MDVQRFDKQRPYTARRLDPTKDTECIETMNKHFNDPENFFDLNSNIIIGKPVKGLRFNNDHKPIPFSYVGGKEQFYTLGKGEGDRNSILQHSHSTTRGKRNSKLKPPVNYEIVDDLKLMGIFDDAKDRVKSNQNKLNDCIENNTKIDYIVKEKFYQQENILKHNQKERCRTAQLTKKLADKVNKQDDEMLIYHNDAYKTKKQILGMIENKKPLVNKFGEYHWMIDLKRPKESTRIQTAYINIAPKTNNLLFDEIKDYPIKPVELTHRPMSPGVRHIDGFAKDFAVVMKKNKINVGHIKNMVQLEIQGKNLLEDELNRARKTSGKKRLYKEPNDAGVHEVIKEDYDGRVYIKNKLFGLK